jgi:hypothetical protein
MPEQETELAPIINKLIDELTPKYLFSPTGNPEDFAVAIRHRPNILIRTMQRLILGFRYIPVNSLKHQAIKL